MHLLSRNTQRQSCSTTCRSRDQPNRREHRPRRTRRCPSRIDSTRTSSKLRERQPGRRIRFGRKKRGTHKEKYNGVHRNSSTRQERERDNSGFLTQPYTRTNATNPRCPNGGHKETQNPRTMHIPQGTRSAQGMAGPVISLLQRCVMRK